MSDLQEVIARVREGVQQHWWQTTLPVAPADLTRLLDAAEAAQAWRPIETAPKDGTWVLVTGCSARDDNCSQPCVVAQWTHHLNGRILKEGHWQFAWFDGGYYGSISPPTHWMPLPPAPRPA